MSELIHSYGAYSNWGCYIKTDIWNIVNVSCGATEPCLFQRDRGKCKNNTIMFAEKVQFQRKCPTKTRIQIELREESFNGLMKCVNRRLIASNNASFGLEFRKISSFVPPDNFSVSINRSLRSHLDTLNILLSSSSANNFVIEFSGPAVFQSDCLYSDDIALIHFLLWNVPLTTENIFTPIVVEDM